MIQTFSRQCQYRVKIARCVTQVVIAFFCLLIASPFVHADSVVVFNEIMYYPLGAEPEWIELYNQMAIDIDLSGWSLCDAYLNHWTAQFYGLLPQQDWSGRLNYVDSRHWNVLTQVQNAIGPQVPFSIDQTAPSPRDNGTLLVTGTGWIDVFNVRIAGAQTNLEIQWPNLTTWQTLLPNRPGVVTLEALNSQKRVVGTDQQVIQ